MDSTSLILGLVFGSIGVGYFVYGRKQQRFSALIAGFLLCVYPYFVDGLWLNILVGVVLMAIPFLVQW